MIALDRMEEELKRESVKSWREWASETITKNGFTLQSLSKCDFDTSIMALIASLVEGAGRYNQIPIPLPKSDAKENAEQKLRRIWFSKEQSVGNFLNALNEWMESK